MAGGNEEAAMAEKQVPVFAVLKNNAILKNIFLVETPPSSFTTSLSRHPQEEEEIEETLVVGRHPDCNITLEHPSISRFHLRIHSKPSSQSLSVIDLSSVHGTWVSGKKLGPGVRVELNDGDTLRLGGSSRIYRLHWVPLSRAYDLENPFVPPMDEGSEPMDEKEKGTREDDLDGLDSVFSDMNVISSAPPVPEDVSSSFYGKEGFDKHTLLRDGLAQNEASELLLSSQPDKENSSTETPYGAKESTLPDNRESRPVSSVQRSALSIWSRRGKPASVQIQTGRGNKKSTSPNADCDLILEDHDNYASESISKNLFPCVHMDNVHEEGGEEREKVEIFTPDKENCTPNGLLRSFKKFGQEEMEDEPILKSSVSTVNEVDDESFTPNKENITSNTLLLKSMKKMGKQEEIMPDKENCTPNGLLLRSSKKFGQENIEDVSILKSSVSTVDEDDDESFTPNKENMTPNTLLLRSVKKIEKLEDIKHFNPCRSSLLKNVIGPDVSHEDHVFITLDSQNETEEVLEANETWEVLQEKNTNPIPSNESKLVSQPTASMGKAERVPFQSLPVESTSKARVKAAVLNDSSRSRKLDHLPQCKPIHNIPLREENKRWTMVVDTVSLVNKESRKALQLLQGTKGTTLIIPRIVVRELDCMNRRGSFFKRTSEASSALQWIEDCMVNTKWWIHVQSSAEEVKPTAPTPPATPLAHFSDENGIFSASSIPFSPSGSFLEVLSPTAQDHILECALFFRRITNGHLVLLSDDVSTKIKAMAEGLLCETAEQFHESLANPFSERFLWSESSPRGPTWCCADDIILRERYYNGPLKKPSKSGEGVKGLKLILLHNSAYRQKKLLSAQ